MQKVCRQLPFDSSFAQVCLLVVATVMQGLMYIALHSLLRKSSWFHLHSHTVADLNVIPFFYRWGTPTSCLASKWIRCLAWPCGQWGWKKPEQNSEPRYAREVYYANVRVLAMIKEKMKVAMKIVSPSIKPICWTKTSLLQVKLIPNVLKAKLIHQEKNLHSNGKLTPRDLSEIEKAKHFFRTNFYLCKGLLHTIAVSSHLVMHGSWA